MIDMKTCVSWIDFNINILDTKLSDYIFTHSINGKDTKYDFIGNPFIISSNNKYLILSQSFVIYSIFSIIGTIENQAISEILKCPDYRNVEKHSKKTSK